MSELQDSQAVEERSCLKNPESERNIRILILWDMRYILISTTHTHTPPISHPLSLYISVMIQVNFVNFSFVHISLKCYYSSHFRENTILQSLIALFFK